jgi:hypothetical protein
MLVGHFAMIAEFYSEDSDQSILSLGIKPPAKVITYCLKSLANPMVPRKSPMQHKGHQLATNLKLVDYCENQMAPRLI